MIWIISLSVFSAWIFLGIFAKATGKELHLDATERIATALEWIAGWLNRVAALLRAGVECYRTLLGRDRENEESRLTHADIRE